MAKKFNIGAIVALDGEKEYRRAVTSINSDMKVLNSEMKLSTAEFNGNANSVEALTQKDKILSDTIDKQKQKVELLKEALANSEKQYGENDTRTDKWKTSLNNAEAQLYKMDDELKVNKKYLAEAENNTDKCATSIDQYGKDVKVATDNTSTFGDVLKANLTSEAIIAGVKAVASGIKEIGSKAVSTAVDTAAYADEIMTLSNNTGIATDTLQELKYMEELTDVSLETVTSTMKRGIRSMASAAEGTALYAKAYEKLGVSVTDSNGHLRNSEDVYWDCIDALGKMTNETERDAVSMQIFGKSAQDLNSIVQIGSDGVREFAQEARDAGAVLDDNTLNSLGDADDAFQRLTQTVEIVKRKFGVELAPSFERGATKITNALNNMDDSIYEITGDIVEGFADVISWAIDNGDIIIGVIEGVTAAILTQKAISTVSKLWDAYTIAQESATTASALFNTVQAASPIGMTALAVGGIVTALTVLPALIGDSDNEAESLKSKIKDINEISEETAKSWESISKDIDASIEDAGAEAGKYQMMADKLYDLANKEKLSNAEKAQMKKLVLELNEAFPEMGLELDSITGKLNLEKEAIDSTIDSYKKRLMAQAAEEDLANIAKEQYNTQKQLAEATELSAQAHRELSAFIDENKDSYNAYNEAVDNFSGKGLSQGSILTSGFARELVNLTNAANQSDEAVEIFNKTLEEQNKKFNDVMNIVNGYTGSVDELGNSTIKFGNQTLTVTKEVAEAWNAVSLQYVETYNAAYSSIIGQLNLFDEFDQSSKYTKEQMIQNLQTQITGMENWSTNMQILAKRGIDEGILKELADMGPQSAGYLNELTKMSDKEISELNGLWKNKYTAASDMAKATAELKTGAQQQFSALSQSSKDAIDKVKSNWSDVKSFYNAGKNIIAGLHLGMEEESSASARRKLSKIVGNTVGIFNKLLGIHSPSTVFAQSGKYSAQGYSLGFEDEMKLVNKKMGNAINTSYSINPAGLNGSNGSSVSFNIANALASAFASLNLKINVDGEDFGTLVSDTIVKEVIA